MQVTLKAQIKIIVLLRSEHLAVVDEAHGCLRAVRMKIIKEWSPEFDVLETSLSILTSSICRHETLVTLVLPFPHPPPLFFTVWSCSNSAAATHPSAWSLSFGWRWDSWGRSSCWPWLSSPQPDQKQVSLQTVRATEERQRGSFHYWPPKMEEKSTLY